MSLAVITFRPALRVARFRADLTFSFDSANSASGTLSAEPVLKRSRAEVVVAVKSGTIVMTLRDYGKGIPETLLQNFKTRELRPESVLAECADVSRTWMEHWTLNHQSKVHFSESPSHLR